MRHLLLLMGFALAATAAAGADTADTPAAAHTRTKRLAAKVTLDAKDEPLQKVLAAVSDQLEDQKLGKLGFTYTAGASGGAKVSVTAKDKLLSQVLDEMLKPAEFGYVVVSKAGDKTDGWLRITRGKERGYEPGKEPKDAPAAADDPDEKAAGEKLETAKKYLADKKPADAKVMLTFVVKKYPKTKAAAAAKELLDKVGK